MNTLHITVNKQTLTAAPDYPLVSGTAGAVAFEISFDESWDPYKKVLIFDNFNGQETVSVQILLDEGEEQQVPWEVLADPGNLRITAVGYENGVIVPTAKISAPLHVIESGTLVQGSNPRTREAWEQCLLKQAEYEQRCKEYAEEAKTSVANAVHIVFDINDQGHIIQHSTHELEDLSFGLDNGGNMFVEMEVDDE